MTRILLSQVAGEGRWTQFNVLLAHVHDFFRVPDLQNAHLSLAQLDKHGTVTDVQTVSAIYKDGSSNWAFEIPGAAEFDFDAQNRPIIAISDEHYPIFLFDLIMHTESRYEAIARFLDENRQTQTNHLARMIANEELISEIRDLHIAI